MAERTMLLYSWDMTGLGKVGQILRFSQWNCTKYCLEDLLRLFFIEMR